MPVSTNKYSNNETIIYNTLVSAGLSAAAACGILVNIEYESGFNHRNLEDEAQKSTALGMTDEEYITFVNVEGRWPERGKSGRMYGTYYSDLKNNVGFGLCQWSWNTRKDNLLNYANGRSIGDLTMQVNFLLKELKGFKTLWNLLTTTPNTAEGAYQCGYRFCYDFEAPANKESVSVSRGNRAKGAYWNYYGKSSSGGGSSGSGDTPSSPPTENAVTNVGQKIVQAARGVIGTRFSTGGDSTSSGFDSPGLVYYSYNEAGVSISKMTTQKYYDTYSKSGKSVKLSDVRAGDLLFYENNANYSGYDYIAIATGTGSRIYSIAGRGVVEDSGLGSPIQILRIISDSQTTSSSTSGAGGVEYVEGVDPEAYATLTSTDPYRADMSSNLSRVQAEGYDYGYLIDMTNGGEFKFYIPEFTEQAGAKWTNIEIRGRSVDVLSYDSTSSRNITISLDLYAGAGLYRATSGEEGLDIVSRMHKDAYFVKSLEYPDYSNVITRPPAVVQLILGSAINITGVVSNVTVEHLIPLDRYNRAMYLKLSFTVTQIATNPVDYSDVRKGQYSIIDTSNIYSLEVGGTPSTNAPTYAKG